MSGKIFLAVGALGLVACIVLAAVHVKNPKSVSIEVNMDAGNPAVSASNIPVTIQVVSSNSGVVQYTTSRPNEGLAASFPPYGSEQHAVLAVNNSGTADLMSPGDRSFSFGLDFSASSQGYLDGENIMQRGLADDQGQYKLDVDTKMLTCTIKGLDGEVAVRAGEPVRAGVWYSARCSRTPTQVTLRVERLDTGQAWSTSRDTQVGNVAVAASTTPLTIGGKVTPDMRIAAWDPDPFNGQVDNAYLQIG